MTNFNPWSALFGGALIGISASALLLLNGRVAGISGILGGLVRPRAEETSWRALFIAGLLVGGLALFIMRPASFGAAPVSLPLAIVAAPSSVSARGSGADARAATASAASAASLLARSRRR